MKKSGWSNKTKAMRKVGKVMHEFKEGTLHSGKSDKIVKEPKQAIAIALSEAGLSKKATGGGVKYYTKENEYRLGRPSGSIEKEILDKVTFKNAISEQYFIGSFGWKTTQGKLGDGYLYTLDEFDQDLIKDLKLKSDEKVFRYVNRTTAIGGMTPFIKINLEKSLLYFPVYNDNDDVMFETKGVKPLWINIIEDKMETGGRIDDFSDKIQEGDIVWDSNNKRYGIVLNTYDYKYNEIRLDSDGNQPIEDLYKLGSKGDKGTKAKLTEALLAHKSLRIKWPEYKYEKVNYADGGLIDINDFDMPVIRSQFEEEEFEFRKGGNITSIEKRVAEVNEMIKKGNELNIKVVDESGTWQSPMKYKPLKYSNGVLYIEYQELDLYKYKKGMGTVWETKKDKLTKNTSDYGYGDSGYAQKLELSNIAKMYRKGINHFEKYGYYAEGGGVDINDWDMPVIRSQFEEEEFEFGQGGGIYSRTMKTPDGNITGKVQYNDFWKTYQVVIDGVVEEEFKTKEEAIENLKNAGFDKMALGGGVGDDLRKRLNPNINEAINHFEHTSVIQQGSKLDLTLRKKYGNFPQDLYIDIDGDNSFTLKFDGRADAFIVYDLTKSKYAEGGGIEAENKEMVLNNNNQIAHHTEEMNMAVKNAKNVPAWVVAKVNRSATDLSDATHYMEGQGKSYADGGGVFKDGGGVDSKIYFVVAELKGKNGQYTFNNTFYETEQEAINVMNNIIESKSIISKNLPEYVLFDTIKVTSEPSSFRNLYADGGGIPNNYLGKSADKVWNDWTETQRMHFLLDHQIFELHSSKVMISFKELPTKVRVELIEHISEGQYANGGGVGNEIAEIKAKIEKAKKNTIMPENLKKQYIEKYEKQLAGLILKQGTKEDVKDFLEVPKGKTPKIVKVEPKGKVKVKEILIHWAEGDNSKYDKFPKTYKTWEAANKAVIPVYEDYAKDDYGGYNKVKFTVTFEDGENYDGRLDVSTREDNPTKTHNVIGQHIKDYLDYQLSEKSRTSEANKKEIIEWLEKYDLGLEKSNQTVTKKATPKKETKSVEPSKGRTIRAVAQDKKRTAKKAGKRTSESGNTYYESRENRSDKSQKTRLENGGAFKDGGGVGKEKLFEVIVFYEDTKAKPNKFGIKSKQFWRKQYKINAKNENDAKQETYKQFLLEQANKHKIVKNVTAFELKTKMETGGKVIGWKHKKK